MRSYFRPVAFLFTLAASSFGGIYGDPFDSDPAVREEFVYNETVRDQVQADDMTGLTSRLKISATASTHGIDLGAIDGSTQVAIVVGANELLSSPLQFADDYTGGNSATWLFEESDPVTGDPVPSGQIKITWDNVKVVAEVTGTARSDQSTLFCEALSVHQMETTEENRAVPVVFAFAGRSMEDRICYTNLTDAVFVETASNGDTLYRSTAAGTFDYEIPTVAFLSPANNSKVFTPTVTVTGTANDNVEVESVFVSVNNGAFQAATGADLWSFADLPLVAGTNTILAYARDQDLNLSATSTRKIIFSPLSPLGISISGQGTITPDLSGTTQQETNTPVTVTAVPAPGWTFGGWTGTVTSGSATITFTHQIGDQLTATFLPGPFVAPSGSYDGLVESPIVHPKKCGFASLSVSATAGVSGNLYFAGKTYKLKGLFDSNGDFKQKINRGGSLAPLKVALHLDLNNFQNEMTGTLTSKGISDTIKLNQLVWHATKNKAPQAGTYTVAFPANPANTAKTYPQGDGFGTMTVTAGGAVTLNATLADGAKATINTHISKDGKCPIFKSFTKGVLIGELTFRDQPGVSDIDGPVTWRRLPDLTAKNFRNGFSTILPVIGSRYVAPASGNLILASGTTGTVEAGSGKLATPLVKHITIDTSNLVTVTDPAADAMALSFRTSNGTFTGTFQSGAATRTFNGVVLQKQGTGSGFFPAGKICGYVEIQTP